MNNYRPLFLIVSFFPMAFMLKNFNMSSNSVSSATSKSCNCESGLQTKEDKAYAIGETAPYNGKCYSDYRVEWVSVLKKKKMSAPVQQIVNGRRSWNFYSNGVLTHSEDYYGSGALFAKKTYTKNSAGINVLHGEITYWYENGMMRSTGKYENGFPVGEHKFFDGRGCLIDQRIVKSPREVQALSTEGIDVEGIEYLWKDYKTKTSEKKYKAKWNPENGVCVKQYQN